MILFQLEKIIQIVVGKFCRFCSMCTKCDHVTITTTLTLNILAIGSARWKKWALNHFIKRTRLTQIRDVVWLHLVLFYSFVYACLCLCKYLCVVNYKKIAGKYRIEIPITNILCICCQLCISCRNGMHDMFYSLEWKKKKHKHKEEEEDETSNITFTLKMWMDKLKWLKDWKQERILFECTLFGSVVHSKLYKHLIYYNKWWAKRTSKLPHGQMKKQKHLIILFIHSFCIWSIRYNSFRHNQHFSTNLFAGHDDDDDDDYGNNNYIDNDDDAVNCLNNFEWQQNNVSLF